MIPDNVAISLVIAVASVLALLIMIGLPIWLTARHSRFERQLLHTERMKAMELGLPPPDQAGAGGAEGTPARPWTLLVVWVPLGIFGATLGATLWGDIPIPSVVWIAAAGLGVTSIICGTILLLRHPDSSPAVVSPRAADAAPAPKTDLDADVLDTVGPRG
jgi:hypothetical protein